MEENEILKQIVESKAQQNLRESIKDEKNFVVETNIDKKVLDNYNQMNESQKEEFIQKGWKND